MQIVLSDFVAPSGKNDWSEEVSCWTLGECPPAINTTSKEPPSMLPSQVKDTVAELGDTFKATPPHLKCPLYVICTRGCYLCRAIRRCSSTKTRVPCTSVRNILFELQHKLVNEELVMHQLTSCTFQIGLRNREPHFPTGNRKAMVVHSTGRLAMPLVTKKVSAH